MMVLQQTYRKGPHKGFAFCGEDYGYNLFTNKKPKQLAKEIIHSVFGDGVENMQFLYWVRRYYGPNNLQDAIEIYYKL